jgi:hypothetical protein
MHRGCFTLDTFRCQAQDSETTPLDHESGNQPLALSLFNPAKRLRTCTGSVSESEELQRIGANLETVIEDAADRVHPALR